MTVFDPTSPDDLAKLRDIAGRATPGPWDVGSVRYGHDSHATVYVEPTVGYRTVCDVTDRNAPNAEHIATFDPPTVTALLDALTTARAETAQAASGAEKWREYAAEMVQIAAQKDQERAEAVGRADRAEAALQRVRDVIAETVAIHHTNGVPDEDRPDCMCCHIQQAIDGEL